MNEELTDIVKLKTLAANRRHGDNGEPWAILYKLLNLTQPLVSDEEVELVYPKKLLSDKKYKCDGTDLEVALFTKGNKIVVAKASNEGRGFQIDLKKKEDISNIQINGKLTGSKSNTRTEAIIEFINGSRIILSNEDDTNQYWQEEYSELIKSIVSSLV